MQNLEFERLSVMCNATAWEVEWKIEILKN